MIPLQPCISSRLRRHINTKLSQLEHILKRPDTYIGSVETISQPMWTYDSASSRMIQKPMSFVPGFYKIVDEILVNAADNKVSILICGGHLKS